MGSTALALLFTLDAAHAQTPEPLTVARIFSGEFTVRRFGPAQWLGAGNAYTTVEPAAGGPGVEVVRYETATGARSVLISAARLTPRRASAPLAIDDYQWSSDGKKLLLFTNSRRVWRQNTRGDYWVLDRTSGRLTRIGGRSPPSSLMFAKFSPDGQRVAYVRQNDLWVQNLPTGRITRLTSDGSPTSINGTSDWVYEEELGIRDGFSWSPDGRRIAFWHFDARPLRDYLLINDTDSLYPHVSHIPYPKAGTPNSRVTVGVVNADSGPVQWMDVVGGSRTSYIARMQWAGSSSVFVQHLNRRQSSNAFWIGDAATGKGHAVFEDRDSAWVDVRDVRWIDRGATMLFESERDGWRHVYRVRRDGSRRALVTDGAYDVIDVAGVDEDAGWLYVSAPVENATHSALYRVPLAGGRAEPVTPKSLYGTNQYDVSPNGRWAFHTFSRIDSPPVTDLVELPAHRVARVLQDNAELRDRVRPLLRAWPTQFVRVALPSGVHLDGWIVRPSDFDPFKKYPVLVHVYGEPASQTVVDRWGGTTALFHRAIANDGYVVVSFDNRGTPAPRGRAWRKVVYGAVGVLSADEQAAAVRALAAAEPYLDTTRVGVWGWSGGGSNTLNAMFRHPDLYRVGVAVAPVPDQRLYDTIYQERYMGLPQENVKGYHDGSPINFAEGLKGRLLVVHGSGDDNVHFQGTERLVNRLIELGKPFDFMDYPNRTHGINEGPGTTVHVYSLVRRYIEEHLPAGGVAR